MSDNLISPKKIGKVELIDNDGRIYPVFVAYTTDGLGNVGPIAGGGGGGGAGDASAANQVLEIAKLTSIDNKTPALVSGQVPVTGAYQATQPVSGVFFQATQPVSTGLSQAATDTQMRAAPIPVSGTMTVNTGVTDAQLRATALPVSGSINLSDTLGNGIGSVSSGGFNNILVAQGGTNYILSTVNSTVTQLAGAATFSGTIETVFNQQSYSILLTSDKNGTLTLINYIDLAGTFIASTVSFAITAGSPFCRSGVVNGNYFKLNFTNSAGAATTTLNINTAYGTIPSATQMNNAPSAINEINGLALNLGAASVSQSLPISLPNDLSVTGPLAQTAINTDLITGTVSGWYDAANFHSASIQVIATAAITAGAISFEQTNDTTNAAAGVFWQMRESSVGNANPIAAALNISSSTIRIFEGAVMARYVRVRISTAVTGGGSFSASSLFSQLPYAANVMTMQQGTAANLNMTATLNAAIVGLNPGFLGVDTASSVIVGTTTSSAISQVNGTAASFNVIVTAASGTTPTMDVGVDESDDSGVNWFRIYDFPRITAVGAYRSPLMITSGNRVRYVQTITGTTPSFTRALNRLQGQGVGIFLRQIFDRTVVLTTLGSTTANLFSEGCSNIQVVINIGTTTIAPMLQLEGSDDGSTFYTIGATLTSVASSSASLTINNVQSKFIRAKVSTAGTATVLGYVLLKAF